MDWQTEMVGGGTVFIRDDGSYLYFQAQKKDEIKGIYKIRIQGMHGSQVLGTMLPDSEGLALSRMISRGTLEQWGCLPVVRVFCEKSYGFQPLLNKYKTDNQFEKVDYLFSLSRDKKSEMNQIVDGVEEIKKIEQVEETGVRTQSLEEVENMQQGSNKESFEPVSDENAVSTQGNGLDMLIKNEEKQNEMNEGNHRKKQDNAVEWIPIEEENGGFQRVDAPERGIYEREIKKEIQDKNGVLRDENKDGFSLAIPYFREKEFPCIPYFCLAEYSEICEKSYIIYHFNANGKPCANAMG